VDCPWSPHEVHGHAAATAHARDAFARLSAARKRRGRAERVRYCPAAASIALASQHNAADLPGKTRHRPYGPSEVTRRSTTFIPNLKDVAASPSEPDGPVWLAEYTCLALRLERGTNKVSAKLKAKIFLTITFSLF
jgi:hypothetical protein